MSVNRTAALVASLLVLLMTPQASAFSGFKGRFGGAERCHEIEIKSHTTDVVLSSLAAADGWNGKGDLCVTIEPKVIVTASSPATPALRYGAMEPDAEVSIENYGIIAGRGGRGGAGGPATGESYAGNGGRGGDGVVVSRPTEIYNAGLIAGGGGGGGGAPGGGLKFGGNGGGGASFGDGGSDCRQGQDGSATSGGAGGSPCITSAFSGLTNFQKRVFSNSGSAYHGGRGGDLGKPGARGSGPYTTTRCWEERRRQDYSKDACDRDNSGPCGNLGTRRVCDYGKRYGHGGAPGRAIIGADKVTWVDDRGQTAGRGNVRGAVQNSQ